MKTDRMSVLAVGVGRITYRMGREHVPGQACGKRGIGCLETSSLRLVNQQLASSETALAYEAGTPTGDGSGIRLDTQSVAGWSAAPQGVRPGSPALTANAYGEALDVLRLAINVHG